MPATDDLFMLDRIALVVKGVCNSDIDVDCVWPAKSLSIPDRSVTLVDTRRPVPGRAETFPHRSSLIWLSVGLVSALSWSGVVADVVCVLLERDPAVLGVMLRPFSEGRLYDLSALPGLL